MTDRRRTRSRHPRRDTDDAFGDLAAPGHSRVGVSGALRARDVDRPTEDDLAAAEREVRIVRRRWTP